MRYLFFGILLIFFSACQYLEEPPRPTKGAMEKRVIMNTVRYLKEEKELYACGYGGRGKDKIQMLALSFFYHKPVNSIEEGRDLLLYAAQRFANEINKETRLHEHLDKYPFPIEDVQVRICIQKPDGSSISSQSLSGISYNYGVIYYRINDSQDHLQTIHKETYEQALAQWHRDQNTSQPTPDTESQKFEASL